MRRNDHDHPEATTAEVLQQCRLRGLRRTASLERLVEVFLAAAGPVSARALAEHPELTGACNVATLYRLLERLERAGVVRRLGLHERAAHYILLREDTHHDYVVCTDCGRVETLTMACPVHELENEVARQTGFRELYHELQFYGRCPDCR